MSLIKDYILRKFAVNFDSLSKTKQVACQAWEKFSEIAQPEIKTNFMSTIWEIIKSYGMRKTLNKSDNELKLKMLDVMKTLKPLLDDMQVSLEMKHAEENNLAPIIPKLGKLKQVSDITKEFTNEEMKKASELLAELMLKDG